jgi:hypothetical protein
MIVLATLENRLRLVKLFFKDTGCDVATYLEDEHKKRQINLSSRLPQFKRFIDPESKLIVELKYLRPIVVHHGS